MSDRRGLAVLFLIMTVTAVAIGGTAIGKLYVDALDEQRNSLGEAARLQLSLLRASPRAIEQGAAPRPIEETARIYRMLGPNGTMEIGRIDGETVIFRFFDVSSGNEEVGERGGDQVDHGRKGCGVAVAAGAGAGGLEEAVEAFEASIAVG